MKKRFYSLIILDGFGINPKKEGNAIRLNGIKNINNLLRKYPFTQIGASGLDVGLPDGQIGNSEVGHLNLGAARIIYQDITRIDKSIKDGDFFANPAFLGAIENCKKFGSAMHLVGLLSDGGVHSSINHLFALIKLCKAHGLSDVFVHCLLDGRDVPPDSGAQFIAQLQAFLAKEGVGKIASICGRYYYMDRDNNWDRVQKGYDAVLLGLGAKTEDAHACVLKAYEQQIFDEFMTPTSVCENGKPIATLQNHDSLIFYNFRADRAREISRAILHKDFDKFERKNGYIDVYYVGMTQYDASFEGIHTAYAPKQIEGTFGEYIARLGLKQLRIAETEKYAHVTFFFNGGVEKPNEGEDRILIPSPKVATYDLQPHMSAYEVTEKAIEAVKSQKYDVMILNYANCDMVGHTGITEAAVAAVGTVDECVGKLVEEILKIGGAALIVADHGNAEQMTLEDGSAWTAHTTNPVPLILVDDTKIGRKLKSGGILANVIPTLLDIMGIEKSPQMEEESLLE